MVVKIQNLCQYQHKSCRIASHDHGSINRSSLICTTETNLETRFIAWYRIDQTVLLHQTSYSLTFLTIIILNLDCNIYLVTLHMQTSTFITYLRDIYVFFFKLINGITFTSAPLCLSNDDRWHTNYMRVAD